MKSASKSLRPYNAKLVTDVYRSTGDVLVEQPTGSGKTMQIVTILAMQLGRRFTHALVSAPQEQIEHGFVHRDYHRVDWPQREGVAVPSVAVPEELILAARKSDLGSVKQIRSYLRLPASLGHALACTHAALNRLTAADLPESLAGKALFIDEAHHASADGLSQLVSLWRERGGQLYFFTATPYRGDGRPVAVEGMRLFRRSLAEHMAEGFAPAHLDSEIVALGKPGDAVTAGQFTGEDAPPPSYFDTLVQAVSRKWVDDRKPKTMVRVPPMRGGSEGLVARLISALAGQGARVLDATGTRATDKQRFLTALQAEKNRRFAESKYDVVVGIQRVLEGTDWPVCSAAYCVGMPGSLNTVVQFLGRAMRQKDADYPRAHRDRARLVFFVPCAGGAALADLSIDHSRHALLTCCFLADHEVGQEWIVTQEVRRGIEAALGSRDQNPAADAENEADEPLDPETRAEIELAMAAAREQIVASGGEPTLGEVVQLAAKMRPDLPETALHRVAAEILAAQPGPAGAKACKAISKEVAKRLRIDPMVRKAMAEAFKIVLHEFRAVTLQDSALLESVGRQIHGVTGGQMREFAQRLRNAAPRPLTEEMILAWADEHHEEAGEWPVVSSGPVISAPEEKWGNLNQVLTMGLRGLPGGSSLAQILEEHRGVPNPANRSPLTEDQVLNWADNHHSRTKKWPNSSSGPIADAPGETWHNVDAALSQGARGLPRGCSLARLLKEQRGVRNLSNLPALTEEQILHWADLHKARTGDWPTRTSGAIPGSNGETWRNVNAALCQGARELPRASSLAKLLEEKRGVANRLNRPLTVDQILAWADLHKQRTAEWPKVNSGPVLDAPGETWLGVHRALSRGDRELPGRTSLAKLLAEHRGMRNKGNLTPLSIKQILTWADAHSERTGRWPSPASGAVTESPGDTWAHIQNALFKGHRGLTGGTTLAQLLQVERGARNIKDLPDLTEKQILKWAETHRGRHGSWPGKNSGPIQAAPGETWNGIHIALLRGRRGLAKGSSLARLIKEYRTGPKPGMR
jgi:hypothetical protein